MITSASEDMGMANYTLEDKDATFTFEEMRMATWTFRRNGCGHPLLRDVVLATSTGEEDRMSTSTSEEIGMATSTLDEMRMSRRDGCFYLPPKMRWGWPTPPHRCLLWGEGGHPYPLYFTDSIMLCCTWLYIVLLYCTWRRAYMLYIYIYIHNIYIYICILIIIYIYIYINIYIYIML